MIRILKLSLLMITLIFVLAACKLGNRSTVEAPPAEEPAAEEPQQPVEKAENPAEPDEPEVVKEPPNENPEEADEEIDPPKEEIETRRVDEDALIPIVSWPASGGGGMTFTQHCASISADPQICVSWNEYYDDTELILGDQIRIVGANFPVHEFVLIEIERPDGVVYTQEVLTYDYLDFFSEDDEADTGLPRSDEIGVWEVYLQTFPGEPIGEYKISASSSIETVHSAYVISDQQLPRLGLTGCKTRTYGQPFIPLDDRTLVLTGFQPGEEVLIGIYGDIPESLESELLFSWYERVDELGGGVTSIPPLSATWLKVIAIGSEQPLYEEVLINSDEVVEYPYSAVYIDDCRPLWVRVVFNLSTPMSTEQSQVFIAGSFAQINFDLPDWDPGAIDMSQTEDFRWTYGVKIQEGTTLEYKYTLGTWDFVEKGTDCEELSDRMIVVDYGFTGLMVIEDVVDNWNNIPPCEPKGY